MEAHRAAIELFELSDDRWGLAVCKVLQARTLLDQDDPTAILVAREGVDHARRTGDRHLLGIALTQIAHISGADGDHQTAISAASEALVLQEQIGYSEGAISALHVLGQSYRLAGDFREARRLHQLALAEAFRIGHAAAVCEAVEDLARTDADERPAFALMLFRAAGAERRARALPLRRRDAEELARLEAALVTTDRHAMTDRPFAEVVAELVG